MNKIRLIFLLLALLMFSFNEANSATISLDSMTTDAFVTPYGTITFSGGEIYEGGGGFLHDHAYPSHGDYAEFNFDFDVDSISFIANSLAGGIYTEALDINASLVDSYLTLDNILFHPVSLSGTGIRRFTFEDGRLDGGWADVTDVVLTTSAPVVPEPISSTLFIVGGAILGLRRFSRGRK